MLQIWCESNEQYVLKCVKSSILRNRGLLRVFIDKMRCSALGVWVAFLKQPDALPGRAPPKK
jgi:hypothetical protein